MLVFCAGLAARALFCFAIVPAWEQRNNLAPAPDAYPELARSLLDTGTLGFGEHGATPTTTRGPSFAIWLTVPMSLGVSDQRWLAFWGSIPGVLAGLWVGWACLRRYGRWSAALAWAICLVHPLPAFASARVMGDEFFASLGVGAVAAWSEARVAASRHQRTRWAAVSGVFLALHILARANGILTLAALLFAEGRALAKNARALALVAAIGLVPALGWSVRTSVLEGHSVFVQSLTWYNFWLGEGFDRFGREQAKGDLYRQRIELIFETAGLPPPNLDTWWWGQLTPAQLQELEPRLRVRAQEYVARHPLRYAARVLRGIAGFWVRGETGYRTRAYVVAVLPLLLLAAIGIARRAGRASPDELARVFLWSLVLQTAGYALLAPMARYSVQVYPALAYLAALAVATYGQRTFGSSCS